MDTAEAIIFYIIVFFAITGALFAVFANKIIHSVISAFITFLSVGILFFALGTIIGGLYFFLNF